MREPVDLRQAVQEEVGRDLADLTFTPAMQERVLAQIQKRPRSRMTWLYPASAAAAVLLILVTTTQSGRLGGLRRESPNQPSTAAPQMEITAAGAANPEQAAASAATANEVQPPAENRADAAGMSALAAPQAPNMKAAGPAFTMMDARLAAGPRLAASPEAKMVVTLKDGAVARIDQSGAPPWQVALPASLKAEQVRIAPNGKVVVGAGPTVLILGPDGSTLESLKMAEPIRQIATGPNDSLALVGERAVYVRQRAGQPPQALTIPGVSAATITSEGLLLLSTPDGLAAYGPNGNRRWLNVGEGGALLTSPDGKVILWGNALYDAEGRALPTLEPATGATVGGPGFLRWEGEELNAFTWAGKHTWSWTAPGFILAAYQGDGERLWVLLQMPEEAQLQALQGATGRPAGRAQTLAGVPFEVVAQEGKLYLRMVEGLSVLLQ